VYTKAALAGRAISRRFQCAGARGIPLRVRLHTAFLAHLLVSGSSWEKKRSQSRFRGSAWRIRDLSCAGRGAICTVRYERPRQPPCLDAHLKSGQPGRAQWVAVLLRRRCAVDRTSPNWWVLKPTKPLVPAGSDATGQRGFSRSARAGTSVPRLQGWVTSRAHKTRQTQEQTSLCRYILKKRRCCEDTDS
jgi:hypothetical protein